MSRPQDLPGWKWMPGMLGMWSGEGGFVYGGRPGRCADDPNAVPDLSDPATGGCCLALLGDEAWRVRYVNAGRWEAYLGNMRPIHAFTSSTVYDSLGAACFAVAEALGRWPGGV